MIDHKPGLSVLIPWYQRDELSVTLAANAPYFRAQAAEVLVLNCAGDSGHLRDLIIASGVAGVRQLDIPAPGFNKCLALNIGIARSRSDTVLTLDTDIVFLDDAFGVEKALMDGQCFATVEGVFESRPKLNPLAFAGRVGNRIVKTTFLDIPFPDGSMIRYQLHRGDGFGRMRPGTGLLLAKKRHLLDIEGYNSTLETWGWEDDDVLVRLQYKCGLRRIQTGAALHLTHGDDRRTRKSGERGQINFLKCCQYYSDGLFLGTYSSNEAWAADRVIETIPDASRQPDRAIAPTGEAFLSGRADCGGGDPAPRGKARVLDQYLPTIDDLLAEARLAESSHENCNLLHIGIGNSRLAGRLASSFRHITGVAADEKEQAWAAGLGLGNYQVVLCDSYSEEFRTQLPLDAYDIIVDCNLASDVCCHRHWKRLMENYSHLLGPAGLLVTSRAGANARCNGGWTPSEDDLGYLAGQYGLRMSKTAYGAYVLRR